MYVVQMIVRPSYEYWHTTKHVALYAMLKTPYCVQRSVYGAQHTTRSSGSVPS